MKLSVLSVTRTLPGLSWRAVLIDETGQVVGITMVSGRTRRQALVSARAIAERVSSTSASTSPTKLS